MIKNRPFIITVPEFYTQDVVETPKEGRERRTSGSGYISNFWTIIHLFKSNVGPGILAMPYAIKNSGVIVGIAGGFFLKNAFFTISSFFSALIFMASICIFCMHSLVVNARRLCAKKEKGSLSHPITKKH